MVHCTIVFPLLAVLEVQWTTRIELLQWRSLQWFLCRLFHSAIDAYSCSSCPCWFISQNKCDWDRKGVSSLVPSLQQFCACDGRIKQNKIMKERDFSLFFPPAFAADSTYASAKQWLMMALAAASYSANQPEANSCSLKFHLWTGKHHFTIHIIQLPVWM